VSLRVNSYARLLAMASIQDPRISDLCRSIIRGQQSEIDQMKDILRDLESRS